MAATSCPSPQLFFWIKEKALISWSDSQSDAKKS
jgi:hypothetical protein